MKQLDNKSIKLGQLIYVKNTQQKILENDIYVALQIEDIDGKNQRCILFTEIEISDMQKISADWLKPDLIAGRIYPLIISKQKTNLLKIINMYNEQKILRISNSQLKRAERRALKNPEDCTKKSLLTDLFD